MIPDVRVVLDRGGMDERGRAANYLGYYPVQPDTEKIPAINPSICMEVGYARFLPWVEISVSSFIHDYLEEREMLGTIVDNRPRRVRCVHPIMTLIEKVDAMSKRYGREVFQPDSFIRHYEDAAQIVLAERQLPVTTSTALELAEDMEQTRNIRAMPTPDEPAFLLKDPTKRAALENAHRKIDPMFWGNRIELLEACEIIRNWLAGLHR